MRVDGARRWLGAAVLLLVVVIVLVPIAFMIGTSFKSNAEITQDLHLWPHTWTFSNYSWLFRDSYFAQYFRNSFVVCGVSVLASLVCGTLAAYSLARFRLLAGLEKRLGLWVPSGPLPLPESVWGSGSPPAPPPRRSLSSAPSSSLR